MTDIVSFCIIFGMIAMLKYDFIATQIPSK